MDGKQTTKYVAFHQAMAGFAALVGFGLVGLGVWMGFGETIQIMMQDAPQNWTPAIDAANPVIFAVFAVAGVLVWQVGKTVALVVTISKVAAASGGASGGADVTRVKQELMSDVNEKLSGLEQDVKRHEQRLQRGSSAADAGGSASSDASASASTDGEASRSNRRSRRRARTGNDDAGSGSSESPDGSNDAPGSDRESNRRSTRRSSRTNDSRSGSDDADGRST